MLTETEDQRLQKLQVMIHALAAPAARAKVGITDERYTELVGYFDGRVRASHVAAVAETEAEARHSDIHEVANHDKWHSTSTAFEHEGRQYRGTRVYDNLNVELSDGDHLVAWPLQKSQRSRARRNPRPHYRACLSRTSGRCEVSRTRQT
jgi:hypothetical protein